MNDTDSPGVRDGPSAPPAGELVAYGRRHSIFFRLVRSATFFALGSLAILFAVTMWQNWEATERSLAGNVDTDIAGLVDIYVSGGEEELVRRLQDRSAMESLSGRQARYLLARPEGTVLTGDMGGQPALSPRMSEAGFITLGDGTQAYARATRLSPDLDLVVARTYDRDSAAMWRVGVLFLITAAAVVISALILMRSSARELRGRMAQVSNALRAAELGQENPLLTAQPADEIGELAILASRTVARVSALGQTHRHMSDHIAHEIRTPLTHLDNRLVNALRELPPEADRSIIESCRDDIKSVVGMLDSLLDIAASEARVGDRSGLEDVDLSELAENLVDLYSGSAEEAGISLKPAIEPGVRMQGEPMQLTRLLSNLLDNALKYVPRGGEVRLFVGRGPVIEVRDDGPGVEESLRPLVFDRFRTGRAVAGKSSHGLGLALVRAIALRHGMAIALVPTAKGAHFVIKPHALWQAAEETP